MVLVYKEFLHSTYNVNAHLSTTESPNLQLNGTKIVKIKKFFMVKKLHIGFDGFTFMPRGVQGVVTREKPLESSNCCHMVLVPPTEERNYT